MHQSVVFTRWMAFLSGVGRMLIFIKTLFYFGTKTSDRTISGTVFIILIINKIQKHRFRFPICRISASDMRHISVQYAAYWNVKTCISGHVKKNCSVCPRAPPKSIKYRILLNVYEDIMGYPKVGILQVLHLQNE